MRHLLETHSASSGVKREAPPDFTPPPRTPRTWAFLSAGSLAVVGGFISTRFGMLWNRQRKLSILYPIHTLSPFEANMTADTTADLAARVQRLEQAALRWRRGCLAALCLVGVTALLGFRTLSPGRVVDAERIILHDPSGRANTVELSATASGGLEAAFVGASNRQVPRVIPEIVLRNEEGTIVARLGPPMARNAQR